MNSSCPKCNTPLESDQTTCPQCGESFPTQAAAASAGQAATPKRRLSTADKWTVRVFSVVIVVCGIYSCAALLPAPPRYSPPPSPPAPTKHAATAITIAPVTATVVKTAAHPKPAAAAAEPESSLWLDANSEANGFLLAYNTIHGMNNDIDYTLNVIEKRHRAGDTTAVVEKLINLSELTQRETEIDWPPKMRNNSGGWPTAMDDTHAALELMLDGIGESNVTKVMRGNEALQRANGERSMVEESVKEWVIAHGVPHDLIE